MGKSVPKGIKSRARVLLEEMPESFDEKFEKNKNSIRELKLPFSKWTTNVMAGFITRYRKKEILAEKKKEDAKNKREGVMKENTEMKKSLKKVPAEEANGKLENAE